MGENKKGIRNYGPTGVNTDDIGDLIEPALDDVMLRMDAKRAEWFAFRLASQRYGSHDPFVRQAFWCYRESSWELFKMLDDAQRMVEPPADEAEAA